MRFLFLFQIFAVFLVMGYSPYVQAEERKTGGAMHGFQQLGKYIWGPPEVDFSRRYVNEAKIPHNTQWDNDQWTPQLWIDARGGSAEAVLNGLYHAGVLTDQYDNDGTLVLQVGQPFIDLSQLEQIRVAKFVDHMFGVTANNPKGAFELELLTESNWFWDNSVPIGLYSAQGLQLQ